jgi:hypothetical protein
MPAGSDDVDSLMIVFVVALLCRQASIQSSRMAKSRLTGVVVFGASSNNGGLLSSCGHKGLGQAKQFE